jgi:hypothetical protein
VNTPAQTRGEKKKKKEKRGPQFATKNLGIWVVKEMTFECFVLP